MESTTHSIHPFDREDTLARLRPPTGTAEFGMWIGLIAIGLMFAAGLSAYWAMCLRFGLGEVRVPIIFWFSTFILLMSSLMWQYALMSARVGHEKATRRAAFAAVIAAVLFLILQIPGLVALVAAHQAAGHGYAIVYGLIMVLVTLHAVHAISGVIPMTVMTRRCFADRAASARVTSLRVVAMYWHFITLVWMVMFTVFLVVH